jgi:small conductance mechanosensitive channel
MDISAILESARPMLIAFGLKVLGAIVAFIVGRRLIKLASRLVVRALDRQKVDSTITGYTGAVITIVLNVILVVALLGYFGIETTSFAALVAGLGVAIGAAWGGLLSNFAAGTFILVLRPFKAGDYVLAGETEGTVRAIGLFSTTIDTPDNVQTLVGNAKIMGGTIKNFSSNPYRRVELLAQIDHSVDPLDAIRRLKAALPRIPNVLAEPKPDVEILTFNERGPVLAVRPYCNNTHYWQVYFDTNASIRATFGAAGYPAAETHVRMRQPAT